MGKLALLRRPCNQSGLKPGGSCIIQLVSGAYEILKSFDNDPEIWSVFLDISKIFVNVWQEDLVYNWKQKGILWNLLDIKVALTRSCFNRANLFFGPVLIVFQGLILGRLLFLIYINDFSDYLTTNAK